MTETAKRTKGTARKGTAPKRCPKCSDSGEVWHPKAGQVIGGQRVPFTRVPCSKCAKGKAKKPE